MTCAWIRARRCLSGTGALGALLAGVLASVVVLAPVRMAHGDEASSPTEAEKKAKAQALVRAASELYLSEKYEEALPLFRQAYELYPSPKILMNTGSTLAELGRFADAANVYQMFLRLPGRDRSKDSEVQAILSNQLAPRLGRLDIAITGKPPGEIAIFIDDQRLEASDSEHIWVTPGPHVVRGEGTSFRTERVRAEVAAGRVIEVKLVAHAGSSGLTSGGNTGANGNVGGAGQGQGQGQGSLNILGSQGPTEDGSTGRSGRGYRIAAWTGAAVTAGALTVALISHSRIGAYEDDLAVAVTSYQEATQSQLDLGDACADARTKPPHPLLDDVIAACDGGERATRNTNIAYAGTAVAAVLTGFFFYKGYISASRGEPPAPKTVAFTATLTPHVAGAALSVRF